MTTTLTPPWSKPLPYTANPLLLMLNDLWLFVQITFTWPLTAGLPSIILPLSPSRSKGLDELALTVPNAWSDFIHLILVVAQTLFLISLFPLAYILLPSLYLLYIVAFVLGNQWFTVLLNGRRRSGFMSDPQCVQGKRDYPHERWVFINGVAVGEHWLQSNLNRLAMTFRRPVLGIHNQTRGIIFDVLECIIQRDLAYPTLDIRQAYDQLLAIISDPTVHNIVLIVHSQGAIEGGMVLDWLYATVAAEQVRKLEVYTFGNAANHWNAPVISKVSPPEPTNTVVDGVINNNSNSSTSCRPSSSSRLVEAGAGGGDRDQNGRVIKYIEHYANTGDYVSRFGILHFRPDMARAKSLGSLPSRAVARTRRLLTNADTLVDNIGSVSDGASASASSPQFTTAAAAVSSDVGGQGQVRLGSGVKNSGEGYQHTPAPGASRHVFDPTPTIRSAAAVVSPSTPIEHHHHIVSPDHSLSLHRRQTLRDKEDLNRFVGRLFKRHGSGHQFNQHYMDNMFEMEGIDMSDFSKGRVKDGNAFMDSLVDLEVFDEWNTVQVDSNTTQRSERGSSSNHGHGHGHGHGSGSGRGGGGSGVLQQQNGIVQQVQVKELSRLWKYRNGGDPDATSAPSRTTGGQR
ncbi:hypothetical protein HRR83_000332 [Exophiala dermatitidis]|uniref:Uncharacterized protein n=1 Tax=Exophiala dermatitidis TaxID=5970 RepID=A0AAN6F2L5_EXODE|nr:hypothetical protein HRR73_002868 [Exophiala dermatitidis]KAJ4524707.1 hypothetical protein HRR75_000297 [Exophiala dermatitidis]KAJ4527580.1 hypothetical protein HRR74_000334 [Exophiala dermatitidis]KAJ4531154.1 hypothetical protein HRR76_008830 [Exophiala dermatitidis]KAJ4550018.1 hypothetical protein HRR78_004829 [Exophiala dermatitidis]